MAGGEDGGPPLTLLEFYSSRRLELEVLSNQRALFLLSFIGDFREAGTDTLPGHLGWSREEIEELLSHLTRANLAEHVRSLPGATVLTARGREFLEFIGLLDRVTTQRFGERRAPAPRTKINWLPPFKPVYPFIRGAEEQGAYEMRLMALAQEGSEDAFEALMNELWRFIYRISLLILHNPDDAQDVTQTVFMSAFQGLRSFRPARPPNVRAWFATIARHKSIDFLRHQRRWPSHETIDPEGALSDTELDRYESTDPDPEQLVLLQEHDAAVRRGVFEKPSQPPQRAFFDAWQQLSERDRLILALRYLDELPRSQIAAELGISETAAVLSAFRARRRLRQLIDEQLGRAR